MRQDAPFENELTALILASPIVLPILQAARAVDLPDWYVGAGLLRNMVWDHLHDYEMPTPLNDVDVAFFDPHDLRRERDAEANAALTAVNPQFEWEATNQAAVHTWHEAYFGYSVDPYRSTEDGVAGWPETATAVAVRLLPNDSLKIFAPCGLSDLFELKLRRNKRKVTLEEFRQRYHKKEINKKWPRVTFIDG
ncbi:MAG: nucleotidyltransferase family protein [Chloroflexota bacterium]